jgi:hypothetical protein
MHKKRGESFWAVVVDPSCKKFLNKCALCGRIGLKPDALDVDYSAMEHQKTIKRHQKSATFNRELAVKNLQRRYEPLSLDEFGRCQVCAQVAEK